jgi:hypothetical protein
LFNGKRAGIFPAFFCLKRLKSFTLKINNKIWQILQCVSRKDASLKTLASGTRLRLARCKFTLIKSQATRTEQNAKCISRKIVSLAEKYNYEKTYKKNA